MRARRTALAILGIALCASTRLGAGDPPAAQDGPRIRFPARELDFGKVIQGEKVRKSFPFSNAGRAPLLITKVDTPCNCTLGRVTKEKLAPGDSAEIEVIFDSNDRTGFQNLRLTVFSNDPTQDDRGRCATNLTLRGEVRSLFRVLPTGAYFGTYVRTAGPRTLEVRITGVEEAESFNLTKLDVPVDWIKLEASPLPEKMLPEGAKRGTLLAITILPHAPLGVIDPLNAIIALDTDVKRQPRLRLPVIAIVADGVHGPELVQFGRVVRSRGKEQVHALERVDGKVGLKVLGFDFDRARLEVESDPVIEGSRVDLKVRVKPDAPPGPFATPVRVRIDDPQSPVVEFPVFGEVVPRVSADPPIVFARAPIADAAAVGSVAFTLDAISADTIRAARVEGAPIAATLVRDAKPRPVVTLAATQKIDAALEASLVIETTIAGEEKLVLPIRIGSR